MNSPPQPDPLRPDDHHTVVCQPCTEACAAFQPLSRTGWSDHGLCLHPLSPLSGYPVLIGRDCSLYRAHRATEFTRAS